MKHAIFKVVVCIIIIAAAIGTAYWGGAQTSKIINKPHHEDLLRQQERDTKIILKQMGSIHEGDTLPDFAYFQTLDGKIDTLSHRVVGPTWLIFMQPDCPSCMDEFDRLRNLISKPNNTHTIIISNGNPLDLMAFRKHYELTCPILYDRNGTYIEGMKVFTFPFNVLVDSSLVVQRITASQLSTLDFE